MSRYAPTPEVMAIGQINISGNVTPANWWKYIRLPWHLKRSMVPNWS